MPYKCLKCNGTFEEKETYCPFCGAKMSYTEPPSYARAITAQSNYNKPKYRIDRGSYRAGFALGFILGVVGLLIAICLDKSETKRGAAHGLITEIVVAAVISLIYGVIVAILLSGVHY